MKKIFIITIIIVFSGFFYVQTGQTAGLDDLLPRLRGFILLQVEDNGEAWYINPLEDARIYMKDGAVAYSVMANLGLGITDNDLAKIPVGIEKRFVCADDDHDGLCNKLEEGLGTDINNSDSDGDGYNDGTEVLNNYNPLGSNKLFYDNSLANRLKGRIVLQVQKQGQAWYVNPTDGKRYYMTDGDAAYQIMRFLSLGITNNDLTKIPISSFDVSDNVIAPPSSEDNFSSQTDNSDNNSSDNSEDNSDLGPQCGNGVVETGEECDGTASSGYICTPLCTLVEDNSDTDTNNDEGDGNVTNPDPTPVCGNGVVETGEECDGSAPSGYSCNNQCVLETLPPVPSDLYSASILGPYQGNIVVAQSDVAKGANYQLKINNQTVSSGVSPTLFLAHYDNSTDTVYGDSPISSPGVSFENSNFGQGMVGKIQYAKNGNIDFTEGTIELWIKLKENISSATFDNDPYIFRYKNLETNDGFYVLIHSSNAINLTMYDASQGWSQAAQPGTGTHGFDVPVNQEVMISATWSQADGSVRFYLNGQQISRRDYDSNFPIIVSGDENIEVGNSAVVIDELRILGTELSSDQIKANYRRAAPFAKNEIFYYGDISNGDNISLSLATELGDLTKSATVSSDKISIVSPDGYFVEHTSSLGVQFNTLGNMSCRYGSAPDLYDNLPYSAGTGTFHSINIVVSDPIEQVPVAIKCRSASGNGDDYGFFRQYRILPEVTNNYPKLSRLWWGSPPYDSDVAYLSKFDMVNFSKSAITTPDVVRAVKEINPNEVILMYKDAIGRQNFSSMPYITLADRVDSSMRLQSSENPGTYCYNPSFENSVIYNLYPGSGYTSAVADHMEKDIFDRIHYFDGIWWDVAGTSFWFLYDYISNPGVFQQYCDFDLDGVDEDINISGVFDKATQIWIDGMHDQMEKTRGVLGQSMLTVGNGSMYNKEDYNGTLWEEIFNYNTFSRYFNSDYVNSFLYWQAHSRTPRLNDNLFANNYPYGIASFYRYHRFGMASSVIAGVYYNPQPLNDNRNTWWFDEYWVDPITALPTDNSSIGRGYLGEPVGPAYVDDNLVWRRNFENGIVIVNNTSEAIDVDLFGQYREINGSQDNVANSGATIENILLDGHDGRILLRPLCSNNPYQDPWCINSSTPGGGGPDLQR